jgi:SagB-type dehydrogenase family enzyme
VRTFAAPLPAREAIARLLTEAYSAHGGRRAVPSAGSIYGLNLYIAATVDRLVWMVSADGRLSLLASGGDAVAYSALVYHQIEGPAWLVFITATLAPYIARYGTRGYRYMLLEAGHLGQELIRLSQAAGLRSCPLGAFDDEGVVALIGGRLAGLLPLYILAIGQTEETR